MTEEVQPTIPRLFRNATGEIAPLFPRSGRIGRQSGRGRSVMVKTLELPQDGTISDPF